jgi:hypothetical protein
MSRRIAAVIVCLSLLLTVLAGCGPAMVKVESGERVTCTYGHIVSSTVKIIEVPADEVDDYGIVEKTVTCDRHKALEKLYAAAQAAIAAGDLKGAKQTLLKIIGDDPNFRKASQQVKDIDAGKTPATDGTGASTGGGQTGGKEPVGPVANLKDWVPDTLAGYTAAPMFADELQISREYVPTGGGNVESLVIVVEQYKDAAYAKQAITARIKADYPSSPASLSVEGRTLYFGTDSRRFGLVAWNEGGLVIAIEASAKDRKPAGLKAALTAVAGAVIK